MGIESTQHVKNDFLKKNRIIFNYGYVSCSKSKAV